MTGQDVYILWNQWQSKHTFKVLWKKACDWDDINWDDSSDPKYPRKEPISKS